MTRCLITLPAEITAGLDFQTVLQLADYPAPAWGVTLHLRGPQAIDLVATASGAYHALTADAAATTGWEAGAYWYSLRATSGKTTKELQRGQVTVLADLAAMTGPFDGRSQAERSLEAINAVLEKRASRDQQRYTINNRELWRMSVSDLLKLRAHFAAQVRRAKGGGKFGRAIAVKFSDQ